ncbi:hypothetical protein PHPALM_28774 [Phytophthora palmivora]|uniref:Uncharacterized protein n=1 Tax=Phytophthora palmivora TaxID=4796 RepID=A0A2P4X996_9STRA|nr:hypothetical protein PHPALM_28774 [Phytophthora palmivora]
MNMRGASEPITTPSSPSVSQVTSTEVVDVTDEGDPWTATSARGVSDPPPLRSSKHIIPKPAAEAAQVESRKGKKKTTKRVPPSVAKRATRTAAQSAESDCEEKVPPPIAKKAKTTLTSPSPIPKSTPASRGTVMSLRGQDVDLSEFMESFQPGSATATSSVNTGDAPAQTTRHHAKYWAVKRMETHRAPKSDRWKRADTHCSTAPKAKGELPPAEVWRLTTHSFPESSKKGKGDYNPP